MKIFCDPSKKHLTIAIVLSMLASIFGYFIVFYPFSIPFLEYPSFTLFILLVGLIFLNSLFWAGFLLSIAISLVIKRLYHGIFGLNNWTYIPNKSIKNITLLIPLSLYLLIFWTYFKILGKDDVNTLLLGWLCLIIIRAAHYADPKDVGNQIGRVIGAFVLPFWLVTFCYYVFQFLTNEPLNHLKNNLIFIQTFIMLLFISFILEIIIYLFTTKEKSLEGGTKRMYKAKIVRGAILLILVVFVILTCYYLYYEQDKTLSIGCLSVSIALLSVYLGYTSDRRMKVLTKAAYDSNYSELNNRRLTLRDNLAEFQDLVSSGAKAPILQHAQMGYVRYHSYSIWKCLTYLKSAMDFQEFFKTAQKEQLIHEIDCLLIDFGNGKKTFNITIDDNYKRQLQRIYDLISGIDIFNNNREKVLRLQHNLRFLKDEGPTTVQDF